MTFYEELEEALLEAIEIKKGNIPLVEVENMPAPTYRAANLNEIKEHSEKQLQTV